MTKKEKLLYLKMFLVCIFSFVFIFDTHGQKRNITGTVIAADNGKPLAGVNIKIKGTSRGVATDNDGKYGITVKNNTATLVFSFIGFKSKEIQVGPQSVINVTLTPAAKKFNEMVVTALGIKQKKKSLGYSTQEVSGEELTQNQSLNLAGNLKGKVSGVSITQSPTPGGSSGIVIRGANSLTGNNQPLIVVDGVPIDNQKLGGSSYYSGKDYGAGLGDIEPSNIKNLQVLKGPNATALYGARAANGAIVITTKSGENREGVGVTINSNVTFSTFEDFPTFQNKYANGYGGGTPTESWGTTTYNGKEYPVISGTPDNWGPRLDGTKVILKGMKDLGPVPLTAQSRNNVKNFFDTGRKVNNSIAVSGGDERTTYRFSVAQSNTKGIVPRNTLKENSFALRMSSHITDNLFVDGKANFIHTNGKNRPNMGISLTSILPNMLFFPRYVKLDWLKNYRDEDGNYRNYKTGGAPYNPYWLLNETSNEKKRDRLIGFLSATYDFTDWLSLDARTGMDTYSDVRHEQVSSGTPTGGFRNGYVSDNTWRVERISADFLLTAQDELTNDISADLSFGGNYLHRETKLTGNTGRQLSVEGVFDISNAADVNPVYYQSIKEIQSLYAIGKIDYKDYLFLQVSGRNDWSSTLGAGNRSYFYPSASLSFVFTDAMNINSSILSFGKLRAAYSQTGKDARPYQIRQGYSISNNFINGQRMGSIDSRIAALNLKNELTKSYEFGTNLKFFNSRLGIDFTYYNESTFNQIFPVNISSASGFNRRVINSGELENSGIEATLDVTPVRTGSFSWDVTLNYSQNNSKVVSLAEGVETQLLQGGANIVTIEARPGEPYGNIIGYPFKRNDAGQKVLTQSGKPQRADERAVLGNIQPDWMGGLSTTFRYKGFHLSGLLDFKEGGEMYSFSKYDETAKGTGIFTEDRESPLIYPGVIQNDDGTYTKNTKDLSGGPSGYYAQNAWGNIGEYFVVDGSYISLKQTSFGYTFQPTFISKTPFASLEISLVARNLLYLQRGHDLAQMGLTPEGHSSRKAYAKGYESRNMPLARTIGFNLNVKF